MGRILKVLLVDDVAINHKLLYAMIHDLCDEGVLAAERATEAIELAIAEQPDLIFMDLGLPDFDGLDAIVVIKNNPLTSHIPIVVVSARVSHEARVEAEKKGCESYLAKPISVRLVREAVVRQLGRKRISNPGRNLFAH